MIGPGILLVLAAQSDWFRQDIDGIASVTMPVPYGRLSDRYRTGLSRNLLYRVATFPHPGWPTDISLAQHLRRIRSTNAKTTHEEDILVDGWPGIDFVISDKESETRGRLVDVDGQLVAIHIVKHQRMPSPTEQECSAFFNSLKIYRSNKERIQVPGPQWETVFEEGYSALHTRHRVKEVLAQYEDRPATNVTYSLYADRLYMTGSWSNHPVVETEPQLQSFAKSLKGWARIGGSMNYSQYSLEGEPRLAVHPGLQPKVVLDADSSSGYTVRFVATISDKMVYFRCFAGPKSMVNSRSVTRWFNRFRLTR